MRQTRFATLVFLLALPPATEPGDWDDPDWQLLREAHVRGDGPGLAAYLRD